MIHWFELLTATLVASLIGSLHCVGMCGPFTILATGISNSRAATLSNILGYHLGRLSTYLILGTLAGMAGLMVNGVGNSMGVGQSAAKFVGIMLVLMGIFRFGKIAWRRDVPMKHTGLIAKWTSSIYAISKRFRPQSPSLKAYSIGLITTWLPCGWLYLFAFAASGSGSLFGTNAMMIAFWLGTLPLLTLLSVGSHTLGRRFQNGDRFSTFQRRFLTPNILQGVAAGLMIAFGLYTVLHRSQIQLDGFLSRSMTENLSSANNLPLPRQGDEIATQRSLILTRAGLVELTKEPLPCCQPEPGKSRP